MNVRPADTAPGAYEDEQLVAALRRGDEAAFAWLLQSYHSSLVRVALCYVSSRSVAEDVVQETWMEVLRGLHRFEGRSALKTWIFAILTNRAKTAGQREQRSVAFSALGHEAVEADEPAVAPERFRDGEPGRGYWAVPPQGWQRSLEEDVLQAETRGCLDRAILMLPPRQRAVIMLRDIEGWTADDVCAVLRLTAANQRALLHRARSRVRGALEQYFSLATGSVA